MSEGCLLREIKKGKALHVQTLGGVIGKAVGYCFR